MQWMPKIPLMSPKPFSGDKKREEDFDTWVRTVPTYVRHKLTRLEQEVVMAASFLEGSAARWLNGLVQQQGYGQDFDVWAQSQTLEQFVRSVYNRWNDPQGAQKATDAINNLCSRRFKDVRELTDTVKRLLVVPGVRFDPQVLLTDYLRCLPTEVRTKLVDEAYIDQHTFASFSKKALDIEAKLGFAHKASNDGRKRLSQDWKKRGQLMFVDHDGQTTEIDDYSDLGEFTEHDGGGETSDGGVVTPIKEKARGTGKKKVVRSTGQGDQGTSAWVKIGLEYESTLEKLKMRVFVLGEGGGAMTVVEVVVDEVRGVNDVLAKRAVEVEEEVIEVDMEAEGGGRVMEPEAEEGDVVVTTWMMEEACCCSGVVIALERSERDAWRESRVAFIEVMREKRVKE
ncbi:hypothetical protein CBR_g25973 [Chara braunii]|uniref:Uncharacterized protein n=1 Tax=Chara braunii TaxID=69332 RepID=A0A388L6Y6_CHABU|nr:hypothetical protein CBR_g25973 [Chara braunii]|eukprot:GBG78038.1 hypothetical protein CBR_g25973 [Chara braunii]